CFPSYKYPSCALFHLSATGNKVASHTFTAAIGTDQTLANITKIHTSSSILTGSISVDLIVISHGIQGIAEFGITGFHVDSCLQVCHSLTVPALFLIDDTLQKVPLGCVGIGLIQHALSISQISIVNVYSDFLIKRI